MFRIKPPELVHWDSWRRFSLPLDARIITIVGPKGSGKTTLLDGLRTLSALRCPGRRDYRIAPPVTHNANVFAPARLALATRKMQPAATGRRPSACCSGRRTDARRRLVPSLSRP